MENYKVLGKLVSISDIEVAGAGKKMSFRIDTGGEYNNLLEFEMYKKEEYFEHLEKFSEYNKIGDDVEVEFNLRAFNWKPEAENKIFTSLSCWKVTKQGANNESPKVDESSDDLPF
jgi:hypothetical protein